MYVKLRIKALFAERHELPRIHALLYLLTRSHAHVCLQVYNNRLHRETRRE